MSVQKIQLSFDKDAVWAKVRGRLSVFLDTNCWIDMADEVNETACRVRCKLKALVASGQVFCPLSMGILEELFKQSGESLKITSSLMEELSLNAIFVMYSELFRWEFLRSVRRLQGGSSADSLSGLFAPPAAAFMGSGPCIVWDTDDPFGPETQENVKAYMKYNLSKIGVVELAEKMGGSSKLDEKFPAYSEAAKEVKYKLKGNKEKLFLEEAASCFYMYVTPTLLKLPPAMIATWSAQFGPPDDEKAWITKALAELPALHNHIDIMVVADSQPDRKDNNNQNRFHPSKGSCQLPAPLPSGSPPVLGWVGEGRDCRSGFRLRARLFDVRVRGSAPSTHRVLGRGRRTGFPPPVAPFSRAPENRRFQVTVQGSRTPDVAPLVKGSSTRVARDLGASHRRTAGQGRVHSPNLVEASTYSGSLPWSVSSQPNACSTRKGA